MYLKSNNLLFDHNFGFRKHHSTLVIHKFLVAGDNGCSSRVVFLDISKACYKMIHLSLLFKLRQFGYSGYLLKRMHQTVSATWRPMF